jgi:hypothetical protein
LQLDAIGQNPKDLRKVMKVSASWRLEKLAYGFCGGFAGVSEYYVVIIGYESSQCGRVISQSCAALLGGEKRRWKAAFEFDGS